MNTHRAHRIAGTTLVLAGADYQHTSNGYRISRGAAKRDVELDITIDGSSALSRAGGLAIGNVANPVLAAKLAAAIAASTAAPRTR